MSKVDSDLRYGLSGRSTRADPAHHEFRHPSESFFGVLLSKMPVFHKTFRRLTGCPANIVLGATPDT
jgi:hypothetical protein